MAGDCVFQGRDQLVHVFVRHIRTDDEHHFINTLHVLLLNLFVFLSALRSVKEDPGVKVITKLLKPMRYSRGNEEKISQREPPSLLAYHELPAASRDHIDF